MLVAHMGLTTKGTIGAQTALTLDDCAVKNSKKFMMKLKKSILIF